MPYAVRGDTSLYYETDGEGDPVAFVGDVGYGAWQWGWQHAAVAGPYESVVADPRGSGRSDAPAGPYAVETLTADLHAVLSDCGVRAAHLVGAGLGGMVALQSALTSSRARSLTLVGTAASGAGLDLDPLFGDSDDPDALRASLSAALSASFVDEQPDAVERIVAWRRDEDASREAWESQAAAVAGFDVSDSLFEVTVPALVIHGTEDAVWPVERGRSLAEELPRGEFVPAEGAGHLAHVEHSRHVNDALVGFLDAQSERN
ncbi:MAG: alpha/beta fold hydrolase [Haloferacaceae archaeon]